MRAPIPINKNLLLKDDKKQSKKQTMMSMKMRELGLSVDGKNGRNDINNGEMDEEMKLKLAMKKELKMYNMPKGGMTGFQVEIILSRVLQKNPDVNEEGKWKDCAQ
jgi:hypothetical protein